MTIRLAPRGGGRRRVVRPPLATWTVGLVALALLVAGCTGRSPDAAAPSSDGRLQAGQAVDATGETVCADRPSAGHLGRVCAAGVLVVSTDPAYPPQSSLDEETGEFVGFDIDVATEIAERLGVDIRFETPTFEQVEAGRWSGGWDVSVGSVTITEDRKLLLDFTQPYYFTPAQLAARMDAPLDGLEDLSGETVCVAEATTYAAWLGGTLRLPEEAGAIRRAPDGVKATTVPTDLDCAESWRSGVGSFAAWVSSTTTVGGAVTGGYPVRPIDEPVFFEPLAVALDRSVADNDSLVRAVDGIVAEMHADGTLSELSRTWYGGQDLTRQN